MDLISRTDKHTYLRTSVPAGLYELLKRKHGGSDALALKELRVRWQAFVAAMGTAYDAR